MNRSTLLNFVPVKRRVKLEFRGKCTSCPWKLEGCHVYTPQATIDEERALGQAYPSGAAPTKARSPCASTCSAPGPEAGRSACSASRTP